MNLSELIERLRSDMDDVEEPYLWSTASLIQFINEAIDEVCLRARLIRDSDSELCDVRLRPNQSSYPVDQRVIQVLRARIKGEADPLVRTGVATLDDDCSGWEDLQGKPTQYIMDMNACKLRVTPTPQEYYDLRLTVERRPLESLKDDNDVPEINPAHHTNMLEWAKHLAYSVQDGDSFDQDAADKHAGKFATMFGQRRNAENEELLRMGRRHQVRPDFF